MKSIILVVICLFIITPLFAHPYKSLQKGRWVGYLELESDVRMYFEFSIEKQDKKYAMTLFNGKERIQMDEPIQKKDGIHVFFSNFNTELVFEKTRNNSIKGKWVNHVKKNYSVPFQAEFSENTQFPVENNVVPSEFSGKWKTIFSPQESPFDAIGLFEQNGNKATGTFLTETGDFRFLSGNISGDKMYLSGFDGSHAYLFVATLKGDKIDGDFYSGTHYKTKWVAEKNADYELRDPDSLSYLVGDPRDLNLQFRYLDGSSFEFPCEKFNDKVVLIQIMGTWCGNCIDESIYFKELYDRYHEQGLEIISIGYEVGEGFEDYKKALLNYQQRFDIRSTLVVGGSSKKSSAKKDFGFLNDVMSFPTTLFINKKGMVVRIHTGFSGPSTGEYYINFKTRTENLIQQLINE